MHGCYRAPATTAGLQCRDPLLRAWSTLSCPDEKSYRVQRSCRVDLATAARAAGGGLTPTNTQQNHAHTVSAAPRCLVPSGPSLLTRRFSDCKVLFTCTQRRIHSQLGAWLPGANVKEHTQPIHRQPNNDARNKRKQTEQPHSVHNQKSE